MCVSTVVGDVMIEIPIMTQPLLLIPTLFSTQVCYYNYSLTEHTKGTGYVLVDRPGKMYVYIVLHVHVCMHTHNVVVAIIEGLRTRVVEPTDHYFHPL